MKKYFQKNIIKKNERFFDLVTAVTRHPMHLFQIWLMISKALDEIYRIRMSKRDLERSKNQKNVKSRPWRVATRRTTTRSKKEKEWCLNDFLYGCIWLIMMCIIEKTLYLVSLTTNKPWTHSKNIKIWRNTFKTNGQRKSWKKCSLVTGATRHAMHLFQI